MLALQSVSLHCAVGHFDALHPSIVPPRGCWLDEPVIGPEAPALGSF
jgi:hypothetical protein